MPRPSSQGGNGSENKAKYCPISIPPVYVIWTASGLFSREEENSPWVFCPFFFFSFSFSFSFSFFFSAKSCRRVSRLPSRSIGGANVWILRFPFEESLRKWINLWISRAYRGWWWWYVDGERIGDAISRDRSYVFIIDNRSKIARSRILNFSWIGF